MRTSGFLFQVPDTVITCRRFLPEFVGEGNDIVSEEKSTFTAILNRINRKYNHFKRDALFFFYHAEMIYIDRMSYKNVVIATS